MTGAFTMLEIGRYIKGKILFLYSDIMHDTINDWRQGIYMKHLIWDSHNDTTLNYYRNDKTNGLNTVHYDRRIKYIECYCYGKCHGLVYHFTGGGHLRSIDYINEMYHGEFRRKFVFEQDFQIKKILYKLKHDGLYDHTKFFPDSSIKKYSELSRNNTVKTIYKWHTNKTPKTLVRINMTRAYAERYQVLPIVEYHWNRCGQPRYIKKYTRDWSGQTTLNKTIYLHGIPD